MKKKMFHVLGIFTNDKEKLFHIWSSKQTDYKKFVTVSNAYSKAKTALSGRNSAQSCATTSFYRVLPNTNQDDWKVTHEVLGLVNKTEHDDCKNLQNDLLTSQGYRCVSRHPINRFMSGRYAGQKWVARLIEKMTLDQVKGHVSKMLEDLINPDLDIDKLKNEIAIYVVVKDKYTKSINNISELWSYVFNNYKKEII